MLILDNRTTDGSDDATRHVGSCLIFATEDSVFDGATVTIQVSPQNNGAMFVSMTGTDEQFTESGAKLFDGKGEYWLQAVISSAGGSTDIKMISTQGAD